MINAENLKKIDWCIEQHRKTNHYYDTYLPYEFHLRMVVQVRKDFSMIHTDEHNDIITLACWGHDLIEDTRTSYNDCEKTLGERVADVIYALTNEKGKNRSERANDEYYNGIKNTPGATFVKLCDRIANVQYSKLTKSRMLDMYKKENDFFVQKMRLEPIYEPMFDYLKILLTN